MENERRNLDELLRQTRAFLESDYGQASVRRMRKFGVEERMIMRTMIQKSNRNLSGEEITAIYDRLKDKEEVTKEITEKTAKPPGNQFTARELAKQFNCSVKTIHNHANNLLEPEQKGKRRTFDESQVTVILESIKKTSAEHRGTESVDLERSVQSQETELTPILRLTQLRWEMEAIYQAEIRRLKGELKKSQAVRDREVSRHEALLTAIKDIA